MRHSDRWKIVVAMVCGIGAISSGNLRADPLGCIAGDTVNSGAKTVVTQSCSQTYVLQNTTATNSVQAYQTTITAELGKGPFLFEASFDLPYSDAAVQAAVSQAESDLIFAGSASYSGPALSSSIESSSTSVRTVTSAPVDTGTSVMGTTTTFGPGTILVGNLGLCQALVPDTLGLGLVPTGCSGPGILFSVLAGQTDINLNSNEIFNVDQVTTITTTNLTSQVYNLNGSTVAATPEPGSIYLLGTGILGIAGSAARRLRNRRLAS